MFVLCFSQRRLFLLTPLREGRRSFLRTDQRGKTYFYSRPCGRGDESQYDIKSIWYHFYSRPCGRGDNRAEEILRGSNRFLLTPLREGRRKF